MTVPPEEELSARELEVLARVVTGATNRQVAVELSISPNTVKVHVSSILAKLGAQSRAEATRIALERGLVSASAEAGAPSDVPLAAAAPARPQLAWPLSPLAAYGILALVLVLSLTALLVPATQAGRHPVSGRLVDAPEVATIAGEAVASRWSLQVAMPTARARFGQAVVDDTIYVIGGQTTSGPTSAVEVYYPGLDLWGRGADKPTAVANVGAVAVDGLIFVPGGLTTSGALSNVLEIYNVHLDAWAQASPLPQPLCSYALAPWGEGFYVFGGWDGQEYVDTVWYYDVASDSWRQAGKLTAPRGFAAAATLGERIYVVGGYDGARELKLCESFAPAKAQGGEILWQQHAEMSEGRAGHGLAVVNGSLYACGGGWAEPFTVNERYDAALEAWSAFASPITGEWRTLGLSAVEEATGTFLYAMGGWSGDYRDVVYAYQAFYRVYIP